MCLTLPLTQFIKTQMNASTSNLKTTLTMDNSYKAQPQNVHGFWRALRDRCRKMDVYFWKFTFHGGSPTEQRGELYRVSVAPNAKCSITVYQTVKCAKGATEGVTKCASLCKRRTIALYGADVYTVSNHPFLSTEAGDDLTNSRAGIVDSAETAPLLSPPRRDAACDVSAGRGGGWSRVRRPSPVTTGNNVPAGNG